MTPFTEREVLDAFGDHVSSQPAGGLLVRYDEKNESEIDCGFAEDGTTDSISINRPCGDDRLLHAVHALLAARPSFLTYPDENHVCIVASQTAATRVREKYGDQYPDFAQALKICPSPKDLVKSW